MTALPNLYQVPLSLMGLEGRVSLLQWMKCPLFALQLGLRVGSTSSRPGTRVSFVMPRGDRRCWVRQSCQLSHEFKNLGLGVTLTLLAREQNVRSLDKLNSLSTKTRLRVLSKEKKSIIRILLFKSFGILFSVNCFALNLVL